MDNDNATRVTTTVVDGIPGYRISRLLDQGYVATDVASALIHLFGEDEVKPAAPVPSTTTS